MGLKLRIVTAVAAALLGTGAAAGEAGWEEFRPPLLDGVQAREADRAAPPGLVAYVFQGGRDWPAIRLAARRPLDWSRDGSLRLAVDNPGATPFRLLLRLDDDPAADGGDRSLTGIADIPPLTRATVVLPLEAGPIGMRSRPPPGRNERPGDLVMRDVRGSVDLHHVVALHISGMRSVDDRRLLVGAPALRAGIADPAAGRAIVDQFGQAIRGDWPEKVASEAALRSHLRDADGATRRLAREAFPAVDPYGGVDAGTRLPATGFYRAQKVDGRWSLVTPAGHLFFSLGVDAVMAENPTIVAGREMLFDGLPAADNPLARFYGATAEGARTFDVGQADLQRALGPDWRPLWNRQVAERLAAWGFNTFGNWSEAAVTQGSALASITFYDFQGRSSEIAMGDGRVLPDPFDPRFPGVADAVARTMTASRRDDPRLLGYFSGNEMPWGTAERPEQGIAAHVLALGADSPAKRAMLDDLRARYGTVSAFGAAWGIPVSGSWPDLPDKAVAWPTQLNVAAARDVTAFQGRFAERYFRTVAEAIRRHDSHHLYLGTRFAAFTPEVVQACARWCDVVSFNVYGRSPADAAEAWRALDRPVLIGEFHFGSADRGSFWPGMVAVGQEAERGPAYAAYLQAAVDDPAIVGCHWYQYADEPVTGRPYDGENGHIGLVAVTGIPFAGFVTAVAAANRRALETFARPRPGLRGTR